MAKYLARVFLLSRNTAINKFLREASQFSILSWRAWSAFFEVIRTKDCPQFLFQIVLYKRKRIIKIILKRCRDKMRYECFWILQSDILIPHMARLKSRIHRRFVRCWTFALRKDSILVYGSISSSISGVKLSVRGKSRVYLASSALPRTNPMSYASTQSVQWITARASPIALANVLTERSSSIIWSKWRLKFRSVKFGEGVVVRRLRPR